MDKLALREPLMTHEPGCGNPMTMAERELSAFFGAVTELFGSEQAVASAEDWLRELMAGQELPASTRHWRMLTIKAAATACQSSERFRHLKSPQTLECSDRAAMRERGNFLRSQTGCLTPGETSAIW